MSNNDEMKDEIEQVPKVFFDVQLTEDAQLDLDVIHACLQNANPFCFNMFNDGEMSIIAHGTKAVASRGSQEGSAGLAAALSEALHFRARNYFVGIPCSLCHVGARKEALDICGVNQSHVTLANLLINGNYIKSLWMFQGGLYKRRVIFVGSESANFKEIEKLGIDIADSVLVPNTDAWSKADEISQELSDKIQPFDMVLFCCGPLGRVLAYKHYRSNDTLTCLELGSFFDPWTQNKAYLYHQNLLPACDVCNKGQRAQGDNLALDPVSLVLQDRLAVCSYKEFYTLQTYDQFFQLYKGDYNRIEQMYKLLMKNFSDHNTQFYSMWSIARCKKESGAPREVVDSAYFQCFNEFSWRVEPMWDYLTSVLTDKQSLHRFDLLCSLQDKVCPNPENCISVETNLYSWRILDEITHQAYHVHKFEIGFKAMKQLLLNNAYPESERERIKANSEFYYRHMSENAKYIQFKAEIQQLKQSLSADHAVTSPMYIHFVCLEGEKYQFDMISYIAVRSAFETNNPTRIFVFTDRESESVWWLKMKQISDRITVILITKPTTLNDHAIWAPQHQCDIMRVNILNEIGGVYMDLDALSIKSVRDLVERFPNKVVMARETDKGLANCVIIACPRTKFMSEWINQYETSYGTVSDHWVGLSVRKPLELASQFKDEVVEMPQETFIPHLYCDYSLFDDSKDCMADLKNSYVCHLYTTELYKNPHIVPTKSDYMSHNSNTFVKLFAKYIT